MMESKLDFFFEILTDKDMVPSPELIDELARKYPFFTLPAATMLSRCGNALDVETRERLAFNVALNAPDPSMLLRYSAAIGEAMNNFYPAKENTTPPTDDAIATFLERYGTQSDEENQLLERLIFNPVPDYASQLSAAEQAEMPSDAPEAEADSPDNLASLLKQINGTDENEPDTSEETPQEQVAPVDTTFSESLAKIFIKQHRYDKALEIISNLSLKFPEKSVYFADQMRFLRKLIINSKYNSKNNS